MKTANCTVLDLLNSLSILLRQTTSISRVAVIKYLSGESDELQQTSDSVDSRLNRQSDVLGNCVLAVQYETKSVHAVAHGQAFTPEHAIDEVMHYKLHCEEAYRP